MVTRKRVYHEGDTVRVVNSRFIKRVGYGLHPADLREEIEAGDKFKAMLAAGGYDRLNQGRAYRKLLEAVCFAEVALRGFGSNERKLLYYESVPYGTIWSDDGERPDMTGRTLTVENKRVAQTGKRYAPWSGQSYEGEWDYEPGGLEERRTHVLLKTSYGEISADDVEPVT